MIMKCDNNHSYDWICIVARKILYIKRVWVQMQNAVLQYHHPRRDRADAIMALRTTPIKSTTTRKKGLLIN